MSELQNIVTTQARQTGRTTRAIDEAVQGLFEHGKIAIIDHFAGPNNERIKASSFMADRFLKRMKNEHPGVKLNVSNKSGYTVVELIKS